MEKLFTVDDVADMTGLTSRTIRNYLADGRLCGRKIGAQWRFTEAEIEALFTSVSNGAAAAPAAAIELPAGAVGDFMTPQPRDAAAICAVIDCPAESETACAPTMQQVRTQAAELGGAIKVDCEYDAENMVVRYTIIGSLELSAKLIKTIRRSGNSAAGN